MEWMERNRAIICFWCSVFLLAAFDTAPRGAPQVLFELRDADGDLSLALLFLAIKWFIRE